MSKSKRSDESAAERSRVLTEKHLLRCGLLQLLLLRLHVLWPPQGGLGPYRLTHSIPFTPKVDTKLAFGEERCKNGQHWRIIKGMHTISSSWNERGLNVFRDCWYSDCRALRWTSDFSTGVNKLANSLDPTTARRGGGLLYSWPRGWTASHLTGKLLPVRSCNSPEPGSEEAERWTMRGFTVPSGSDAAQRLADLWIGVVTEVAFSCIEAETEARRRATRLDVR